MSNTNRAMRRKALHYVPDISLVGSGLDRVLSGFITEEVKNEMRKDAAKMLGEAHFDVPERLVAPTPFTPKATNPMAELRAMAREASGNGALARFALAEIERLTQALAEKEKAA